MSKKSIFHRSYRHLILPGVTLGVDVSSDGGYIAVTAARLDDGYCRDTGRFIINTLFDENDQTLRAAQFTRNVFSIPYMRGFSSSEVIQPLLDFISESLNERAIYRVLRQLFIEDATTKEKAKKAAERSKNSRIVSLYANVVTELDPEDVSAFGKLRTLNQFDRYFFDWRGSANAIINSVKTFAQLMYQEMELESEMKSISSLISDAKKDLKEGDKDQLEKWQTKLKKLSAALIKTKKATGAAHREKIPVEKTAKPVKVLPRTSTAPSGRPIGVAPCLDVLEKISSPEKSNRPVLASVLSETPPPLPPPFPEESETPPPLPPLDALDEDMPALDKIEEEDETKKWRQPLTLEEKEKEKEEEEESSASQVAKISAYLQDPEVSAEESDDSIRPPQALRPPIEQLMMLPED